MANNKYLTLRILEDNDPISGKFVAQILSLRTWHNFSSFEIFNDWFV